VGERFLWYQPQRSDWALVASQSFHLPIPDQAISGLIFNNKATKTKLFEYRNDCFELRYESLAE
jgi:hypothetical protein